MSEVWDVYDGNRCITGKTITRENRHLLAKGEYHLIVCAMIVNSDHQVLIQRRSLNKTGWPGAWADTGGAALSGETSVQAIIREVYEELGILVAKEDMVLLVSQKIEDEVDYFRDAYIIHKDIALDKLILDSEEVLEAKWVTIGEIEEMVLNGEFLYFENGYLQDFLEYMNQIE